MIYFIQSSVTQHIKIGYAKNSKKRLAGLQSANADQLKLLGEINGELEDELEFHEQFAKERLHGEWFKGDILPRVQEILARDAANPRPPKLNVIVSGDSDFRDDALIRQALDELDSKDAKRPISWVLLGGWDRFVDRIARAWANAHNVRIYQYAPKWSKYGKGAGSKVNRQLICARFDTKLLLVFLAAKVTPTTQDLIRRATKARIEVVKKGVVVVPN
jgi:hypothetical protein